MEFSFSKAYVYFLLTASLILEALSLVYLLHVDIPFLMAAGLLSLSIYMLVEAILFRQGLSFFLPIIISVAILIATAYYGLLSSALEAFHSTTYLVFFVLYVLLSTFSTIQVAKEEVMRKRYALYLLNTLVLMGFIFVYAILTVYITYEAAMSNLKDTGRIAPIKKAVTYFSGTILLAYNAVILVLESMGLYEPNQNLYYVSAIIVVTVLLAARNMVKFLPKEGAAGILRHMLPSFIALYVSSYALIKFYSLTSVVDGLAKSMAALAAIIEYRKGEPPSFQEKNL